jgi:hypothetical protein
LELIILKFGRARPLVKEFFVKPVSGDLNAEQAFALYRRYVQSGQLPDVGSQYDSYVGPDRDQNHVAALFFPAPGKP